MIILAYAIVTFALIGLLSNFFFIFFEEANNELNEEYEKAWQACKEYKDE
jgi:hypothetical protein